MELSVETFDQICRACLISSTNMKSLFTKLDGDEKSLMDLFSLAANLTARTEDGLPKQVCSDCELTLYKAEEFRKTCLQSDTILKELFTTSTHEHDANHAGNEVDEEDVKSKLLFFDKISDFEIQVVEKKDIVDNNQDFGSDLFVQDNQKHDDYLNNVKEEAFDNDQDLENDYDDVELELPIELKEEPPLKPKATNYSQYKKQWKSKKKTTKIPFRYTCKECNLDFDDEKLSIDHLQGHTKINKAEDESYQCSLCFRQCKTKKTLSKHMKLHQQTDNIRYSCDRCKREFKYKSFLENHVISVHMHNEYNCHICKEKFKSKQTLEAHIDTHKEKKKHICNICSKAFIMLCTLKDHMRKHTGEKPFLCCTCGKGFSQKTNLAQHTRRHLGVKPFKCNICSKCFVSKGELDAHTRKHSGAHPFVCDDCGNGFTTSSALVKHRRTHTGERPYACDLCHMRFAASGTLKNHRRTHTGERPFQCSLCEKAFVQRTDLISHIRCHTGERPYICSQCGQAFRKAAGLKAHLKMHGKDLPGMHGVILNGGRE